MASIARSLPHFTLILALWVLGCSSEPPPQVQEVVEPEEELALEEAVENYVEEYIPPPEEPLAPPPPPPPAKPSWVYGYQSGHFSGNEYTPGTYNFGSASTQGMQVFYSRQCDCVYARNDGQIIGIVQVGDHLLAKPHSRAEALATSTLTAEKEPILFSQDGARLVKIQDGALILPRALVQDPVARSQKENSWK